MSSTKKTKGLSYEEKRKRMSEYFLEKRDFFQLKELEKSLPKEKGIVMQSVKEVLQSLVDDRLVNAEKIGTSNYFWSFPSTAMQTRKAKIESLQNELEKLRNLQTDLQRQLHDASSSRQDGDERAQMISKLAGLEAMHKKNQDELVQFQEMDPDLFDQKKAMVKEAKEGADRWTDNIFALQTYCANNFDIGRADFAVQFAIPEDFDYVQ